MKLLSIKAHGFKSFADKIEILIGDGITGIVGPNGSGKSNVVDAVKWVLGEQSLKEIRGGETMSDVIFNGSASRAPLTRAWVSLTFDNSDHYLASDLTEIEIKRVVYATGENEYFINNNRVRKKDITDLFIDSGANADSFSIISQGKISEVLKGRPSDRRVIIEEASGVLKYKKRKEETTKKLDNAQDNLEKVSLVIDELATNLEPLRIQATEAKKYLAFKEELKGIEIALLAKDIRELNDDNTKKNDLLKEKNAQLLNLDSVNNVDNAKLESLKTSSMKLDEAIGEASSKIMVLSGDIANLETRKQVISERKKYEVDDQKLESNILNLKENQVLIKKNITVLEQEIFDTTKTLEEKKKNLAQEDNEYRQTFMRRQTLIQELTNKTKEEATLKNRLDILNDNINNDTKLPYAVKSILNNVRLHGIHDALAKLIDTKEEYSQALETALGANSFVVVVDDETSAKEAINYLKDNKLGRATFFPLNVITPRGVDHDTMRMALETAGFIDVASNLVTYNPLYKSIVENQLGNILIVDNIDTMNALGKKIGYRYRIITLDGEILHTGGAISGGINKASNGLLNTRFELEKVMKSYDVAVNEAKLLEEHVSSIDDELKLIEDKNFTLKGVIASLEEGINRKQSDLNDLKRKDQDIENELKGTNNVLNSSIDKELDQVMQEYLEKVTKKELEEANLSKMRSEKNDLLSEINEIEQQARKEMSEYNRLLGEVKDLEVAIGKTDIKLDGLLNHLSEEYALTYERATTDYVLDIDETVARNKVNHLKRSIKDLGDVNVGSIAEYERINTRYTFLTDQRQDLETAIANLKEIITDLDQTMIERFSETFNKVNEEFGRVFQKLFKGGKANLVLTEPDDLLNTGVDIVALPPGKSLKNINILSGGEMTLTAIALLFSILNIRTVPFCILDEVEAALDEANVDTFGTYIKEYEKNSQFIVITHKKRTMEYVNTLYGITMQESGVSKLVSVRLENI